jgi:DNA-binding winged helix-turn-helix (wHTH) protein
MPERRLHRTTLSGAGAGQLRLGNLTIDPENYRVSVGPRTLDLTLLQFKLLVCLANRADSIITQQVIWDRVWGPPYLGPSSLRTAIWRLRRALKGSNLWVIESVPKRGYGLVRRDRAPQAGAQ